MLGDLGDILRRIIRANQDTTIERGGLERREQYTVPYEARQASGLRPLLLRRLDFVPTEPPPEVTNRIECIATLRIRNLPRTHSVMMKRIA